MTDIYADGVNEYGTEVTILTCTACGRTVSVCPALSTPEERGAWGTECLADTCPSYDISRDIDIFWDPAMKGGLIQREEVSRG